LEFNVILAKSRGHLAAAAAAQITAPSNTIPRCKSTRRSFTIVPIMPQIIPANRRLKRN
jgi:hypothetical protein